MFRNSFEKILLILLSKLVMLYHSYHWYWCKIAMVKSCSHDMLGRTTDFSPRFLRRYLDLESQITGAVEQYCEDVRSGDFPNEEESY